MPHHWIDGHLDLAAMVMAGRDIDVPCQDPDTGCISLPDLRESPIRIVFGTIYTSPAREGATDDPCTYTDSATAFDRGSDQLDIYEQLEAQGAIAIVRDGLRMPEADDPLGLYILMEGADPIRNPEDAAWWHQRGLRMVGLTWSLGTRYAGGNATNVGLSGIGRELVAALDDLKIVHDASHCSEQSLEDLFDCARGTIVATHSNSRAIIGGDNQRHLLDEQAREIFARGGVIGLNLYSNFLAQDRRATISDCVDHVMHYCELAGNRKQVALGSDYDGGFTPAELPIGLEHPRDLPALAAALAEAGFNEEELLGFTHANWLRCLNPSSSK